MILNLIFIGLIFFLNNQLVDADNWDWKLIRKTWYQGIFGYIYKTSIDGSNLWYYAGMELEEDRIPTPRDKKLSELGQFFKQFYQKNDYQHIMYNDEPPNNIEGFTLPDYKRIQNYGKGRGVILWDSNYIIWVIHSIERYPLPFKGEIYEFSVANSLYAQSILFVKLNLKDLKTIIKHLIMMEARVYDMNLRNDFEIIRNAQKELNEIDSRYQDLIPRTNYRRGSATSLMSSDSKYSSTSHSVRTNSDSKIKDHFVSNLKALHGTNVRIITKTSKKSDELWSKVQYSFQDRLYIKSHRFYRFRDYGKSIAMPNCGNSNFVEILRFHIDLNLHDYKSDRTATWSYDKDKSRFAICNSKSNCFCMSNSNKKKGTKALISDKAGMAVCLFDDKGSERVKNLNLAIKRTIHKKSCKE